jgi:hypothetical protein
MGSTLFVSFAVTAGGAFTAGSGDYAVSLPLTVLAGSTAGSARLFDSSTGNAYVGARVAATTGTTVGFQITPTFLGALGNVAHIFPWTWATGDIIDGFVTCELA